MPAKGHKDLSKYATTTCPTCGKVFEYLLTWPRKFCSRPCSGKVNASNLTGHFTASRFEATCEQCGAAFETTPTRNRGRFCSLKCFGTWQSRNVRGEAHPNFGKKVGRPSNAGEPVYKKCEVCDKDFLTKASHAARRKCCSKLCQGAQFTVTLRGEGNPHWKGGYLPYYGPTWRKAQREARKRDKVCQGCGKTRSDCGRALDVHHIIPFRVFGLERHADANDLSNLVALCQSCHLRREPRKKTA